MKYGQWQPIETAPMDGTWVLLRGGRTTEDDYNREGVNVYRPVVAFYETTYPPNDAWLFCYWDGSWRTGYENPTHWMPLPPPPESA